MKTKKNIFYVLIALLGFSFVACNESGMEEVPDIKYEPAAVTNFLAIAGEESVALSWTHSDASNTTGYELTYSPDGETAIAIDKDVRSYSVTGLTNDTEYTFSIVAVNDDLTSSAATATATPKDGIVVVKVESFTFEAALNPNMALDTADVIDIDSAVIDHEAKTITIEGLSAYVYLDSLIPTFTLSEDATVTVNDVAQVSGETAVDFSAGEISYVFTADGDQTVYRVNISKSQYATIPDAELVIRLKVLSDGMFAEAFNSDDQLDITNVYVTDYAGQLDLDQKDGDGIITSIKGIEFFKNMTDLRLESNEITNLDLRKNPYITGVAAGWNKFSSVNVSTCVNMKNLYLLGSKELTYIDISNNQLLQKFYIDDTSLEYVDVSKLAQLATLRIEISTAENSIEYIKQLLEINPDAYMRFYNEGTEDTEYVLDLE